MNTYQIEYIQFFEVEAEDVDEAERLVSTEQVDPIETELNVTSAVDEDGKDTGEVN